ncbi:amidase [Prosthecomicrobium sp. N25]|uniref:amidase n=1 Tax=Prosthecomicrobium sp. N25 TaxID=3129254 RepID=UPI00307803AC
MTTRTDFSEITISRLIAGYEAGEWTAAEVVAWYLDRIRRLDRAGPRINAVISVNAEVEAQAAELDRKLKESGPVGPLHGVPILVKDQIDVREMPTTCGSILFRDNWPKRDAFLIARLRAAGALMLGKTTLGEMGAGDTHGSLFGSTRNVYAVDRTAGGSSGGSGAAVSANFCTVALGQEGFASIRRPSIWNGVVGMRPSVGLVSRGGVYDGWPSVLGSVGPMARTVEDAARILDVLVGYDPVDPVTAHGVGKLKGSFVDGIAPGGLQGVRLGVLRTSIGVDAEPDSEDFKRVRAVFDASLGALTAAGATLVDPIEIPELKELLALRAGHPTHGSEAFEYYVADLPDAPYRSKADAMASPQYPGVSPQMKTRWAREGTPEAYARYLEARDLLMTRFLKVMADHDLDAIVHTAIEHEPTLIADGINPPWVNHKGAPHINTFLGPVPTIVVPAGYTSIGLPAGIAFLGRPYDDLAMVRYAYAFEQQTKARRVPDLDAAAQAAVA